jgi:hypothetical protein
VPQDDAASALALHVQDDAHWSHAITQGLVSSERKYGCDDCHGDLFGGRVELDEGVHLLAQFDGKSQGSAEDVTS